MNIKVFFATYLGIALFLCGMLYVAGTPFQRGGPGVAYYLCSTIIPFVFSVFSPSTQRIKIK